VDILDLLMGFNPILNSLHNFFMYREKVMKRGAPHLAANPDVPQRDV